MCEDNDYSFSGPTATSRHTLCRVQQVSRRLSLFPKERHPRSFTKSATGVTRRGLTLSTGFLSSQGKPGRNPCSFPSRSLPALSNLQTPESEALATCPRCQLRRHQPGRSDTVILSPVPLCLKKLSALSQINLIGPAVCVLRYLGTWMLLCAVASWEN